MAANTNYVEQFLRDAEWIQCNQCIKKISRTTQFFVLTCSHIFCYNCAKNAVKTDSKNEIVCPQCKNVVQYQLISHNMNQKTRQNFEPIDKYCDLLKIAEYQQKQRSATIQNQIARNNLIRNTVDKVRGKIISIENEKKRVEEENRRIEQQILKYMSKRKLDYLLENKTYEEIERMNFTLPEAPKLPPKKRIPSPLTQTSHRAENNTGLIFGGNQSTPVGHHENSLAYHQQTDNIYARRAPCTQTSHRAVNNTGLFFGRNHSTPLNHHENYSANYQQTNNIFTQRASSTSSMRMPETISSNSPVPLLRQLQMRNANNAMINSDPDSIHSIDDTSSSRNQPNYQLYSQNIQSARQKRLAQQSSSNSKGSALCFRRLN